MALRGPSYVLDFRAPLGWGPGPWDEDRAPFDDKAYSSGDIRPWGAGDPLFSGRVRATPTPERYLSDSDSHRYYMLAPDSLQVECWCRRRVVSVSPEVVNRCETASCGDVACVGEPVEAKER